LQSSIEFMNFEVNPPHIPHENFEDNNLSLISRG
jgi:hypothetical protein